MGTINQWFIRIALAKLLSRAKLQELKQNFKIFIYDSMASNKYRVVQVPQRKKFWCFGK